MIYNLAKPVPINSRRWIGVQQHVRIRQPLHREKVHIHFAYVNYFIYYENLCKKATRKRDCKHEKCKHKTLYDLCCKLWFYTTAERKTLIFMCFVFFPYYIFESFNGYANNVSKLKFMGIWKLLSHISIYIKI